MKAIYYNRICIMCPTYHRSNRNLPIFISSAMETIEDYGNVCFCFIVNENDFETVKVINEKCGDDIEFEILYEKTDKCNLSYYFNYAYDNTKFNSIGTCVSMFGDDMVFVTKNWDTMVLEKMNEMFGYGLIYGDDDYCQHENLCVYFVTTRELVSLTGKPFMCEMFAVDFIDNIWMDFANKMKCAKYLKDWHVLHNHVAAHGKPDDVWLRMRTQYDHSHRNFVAMAGCVDEMVANAKVKLKALINNEISFCMTTYDRVTLFQQTVNSWNRSFILPEKIFVFDDNSTESEQIYHNIFRMENAFLVPSKTHLGCNKNNAIAVTHFNSPAVTVIDSDTIFSPFWYLAVLDGWEKIKDNPDVAGMTIFNATDHKFIDGKYKETIGGFGGLFKREIIDAVFKEIDIYKTSITWPWDHAINDYAKKNGLVFYCDDKSYLQHIGYTDGTHISDGQYADFALDFVGEQSNPIDSGSTPIHAGGTVLVAAMARLGDVVAASMVINMIIAQNINVSWMVINRYVKIAKRFSPNAKIISVEPIVGGPQGEWSETTTEQMKKRYPGYGKYINCQIGARENHQSYITSGLHPCEWMKNLCNSILGLSLPDNYRDFLSFDSRGITISDRQLVLPDTLAIICKDSMTVPPFPPEMFDKIFKELLSQGYSPRYLVKEKPDHLSIRTIRAEYIYGLSIEQCIIAIQRAKLFIGQDSGLSWCSLLSPCKKKIYHRKERIEIVNTFYRQIDENAEDIIVGG